MNSIKTIIIAATLSTLSLGAAQAAETIKPVQAASFHDGTKHAVAYFLNDNATCKLVVMQADDATMRRRALKQRLPTAPPSTMTSPARRSSSPATTMAKP